MDNLFYGLRADMPNNEYHAQPHMSSTGFKLLARSPLHWWSASGLNPERVQRETTNIMLIGTAWHAAIWEPELFASEFRAKPELAPNSTVAALFYKAVADGIETFKANHAQMPEGLTRAHKEGKSVLAELEARGVVGVEYDKWVEVLSLAAPLAGKTLLSASDLKDVETMAAAARNHKITQAIFNIPGGMPEVSIMWRDRLTGAPCRIRPDYAVPPCAMFPNGLIVDGKSNADSSPIEFGRSAWNSDMYFQAAFYADGYQQHFQTEGPPVFAWLSQERDAPYATAYYSAPPDFMEYGRKKYRRLLRQFAQCLAADSWPGYSQQVLGLHIANYAAREIETYIE